MELISCNNVSFAYDGNTVVSGLNFSVNCGDYLCIVGENGSGKSTLIKGLLRLKQPFKGDLSFNQGLKRSEMGYLPQQTAVQKDFPASVYEVVLSGRLSMRGIRPFYTQNDKRVVEENLSRLGIENIRKRCYRELSGGQQQRVLLARALCATQKVLLLDEPVAGLDPLVTQELYFLIEKINKDTGITIIMVSHDIQSAVKYAGSILHLKNQQAFFGTAEEYAKSSIGRGFLGGAQNA
ncbi:metal ABC transporter ATP-binding protein [Irregularibacter muris]|uniref:Metal ABC transporter ATP-binding protein n=1 Tax=Irregularibacter muris TaxID=1796619 RepID=A0AAE3HGE4_9FIRM|nr:metal ABC transporter ATP-binding protein [Irregularibacter muris]MCR1900156.1 metal ABC transporter ATP-binding protein [Irregularibacter muris]